MLVFNKHKTNPKQNILPSIRSLPHRCDQIQARCKLRFQREKDLTRDLVPSDAYDLSDKLFSNGAEIAIHLPYKELFAHGESGATKASQPRTQEERDTHRDVSFFEQKGWESCQRVDYEDSRNPCVPQESSVPQTLYMITNFGSSDKYISCDINIFNILITKQIKQKECLKHL